MEERAFSKNAIQESKIELLRLELAEAKAQNQQLRIYLSIKNVNHPDLLPDLDMFIKLGKRFKT